MSTRIYFQIGHGKGTIGGADDKFTYDSAEEAIRSAKEFKNDPQAKIPKMSDENAEYWKNQTYIITKTVKTVTEIATI